MGEGSNVEGGGQIIKYYSTEANFRKHIEDFLSSLEDSLGVVLGISVS